MTGLVKVQRVKYDTHIYIYFFLSISGEVVLHTALCYNVMRTDATMCICQVHVRYWVELLTIVFGVLSFRPNNYSTVSHHPP